MQPKDVIVVVDRECYAQCAEEFLLYKWHEWGAHPLRCMTSHLPDSRTTNKLHSVLPVESHYLFRVVTLCPPVRFTRPWPITIAQDNAAIYLAWEADESKTFILVGSQVISAFAYVVDVPVPEFGHELIIRGKISMLCVPDFHRDLAWDNATLLKYREMIATYIQGKPDAVQSRQVRKGRTKSEQAKFSDGIRFQEPKQLKLVNGKITFQPRPSM